jgi:hypothetical protein
MTRLSDHAARSMVRFLLLAAFLVWRSVTTDGIDMLRMMNGPGRGDEAPNWKPALKFGHLDRLAMCLNDRSDSASFIGRQLTGGHRFGNHAKSFGDVGGRLDWSAINSSNSAAAFGYRRFRAFAEHRHAPRWSANQLAGLSIEFGLLALKCA